VSDFVIGLGANLGSREQTLASAASALSALSQVELCALSQVYESDALVMDGQGALPQPRFLNAAVRVRTELSADALFERMLAIEAAHGRVRMVRWGARTLDLDILWSDAPASSSTLEVPHAALSERTFALAPLLDVAPELEPTYGGQLAALGGAPEVRGRLVLGAQENDMSVRFEVTPSPPV
jgi:2-amino-4-hydroxy-6-hydroxymethyldihydropteridine diphosphokinase